MCGLVGMVTVRDPVNYQIYEALTVLQHRGQDAAGIVTSDGARLHLRKDLGLVQDVFDQSHIDRLTGRMGIGHVRYPTAGSASPAEAQPMYVNSPHGITLAHNGNLINAEALQADLFRNDRRHINTGSDSEVLLNVLAHELQSLKVDQPGPDDIFEAVRGVHERCRGAYAVVALVVGTGMVGFRDPHGIRPLAYGRRQTEHGFDYMIASESVAIDIAGFELIADVAPGEAIFISESGKVATRQCTAEQKQTPCIFEYVYLARPDSIIDEISVYKSRLRMGERLARRVLDVYPTHDHDIDVVIPVPHTGCTSALPVAHELNVKYREGFVKNRYIGRTFIMPEQHQRQKSVRRKLNAIDLEFRGKNVLLVDDSIVRGTTTSQIVQMAREAGARKVYLASAAPPIRHPNVYGIDMPAAADLVAYCRSDEEVARQIGADWLVYQTIDDLVASAREGNPGIVNFECSIFNGDYVTGGVDQNYVDKLSLARGNGMRQQSLTLPMGQARNPDVIDLHNHG